MNVKLLILLSSVSYIKTIHAATVQPLLKPLNVRAAQRVDYRSNKQQIVVKWDKDPLSASHDLVMLKRAPAWPNKVKEKLCNGVCFDEDFVAGTKYKYKIVHLKYNGFTAKGVQKYKKAGSKPYEITPAANYSNKIEFESVFSKGPNNPADANIYTGKGSMVFGTIPELNWFEQPLMKMSGNDILYWGQIKLIFYEEDGRGIRKLEIGGAEGDNKSEGTTHAGSMFGKLLPNVDAQGNVLGPNASGFPAAQGWIDCKGGQLTVDNRTILRSEGEPFYDHHYIMNSQSLIPMVNNVPGSGYLKARMSSRVGGGADSAPLDVILTTGYSSAVVDNVYPSRNSVKANDNDPLKIVRGVPFNCNNLADQRDLRLVTTSVVLRTSPIVIDIPITVKLEPTAPGYMPVH